MSLHRFLSKLIWLCVGPLIVLAGILAASSVITKQAEYKLHASNLAKSLAAEVDQYLHARISALHMLAESSLVDDPSRWKDLYREALGFQHGFGSHVILADREMHMLFNTRAPFGTKLPDLPRPKGQAAAPLALQTGEPAVGDVFWGPIAKEPLVAIVVPVHRGGGIPYLMLSIFETKRFQEQLSRMALPSGWSLTILDSSRNLIARRAPANFNSAEDVDASGRVVIQSSVAPWSIMLEIPRSVELSPLVHTTAWLVFAILMATLVSLVGGTMAGRRLGRAVSSLADKPASGKKPLDIIEIDAVRRLLDESAGERQKAEEMLRQAHTLLQNTFDAIPDLLTVHNRNLQVVLSNWRGRDHISEEERGSSPYCYSCYMRRNEPCEPCPALEVFQTGRAVTREVINPHTQRITEVNAYPVFSATGEVELVTEHVRDITERKRMEEALKASEEHLRLALESANAGTWEWDLNTNENFWSRELFKVYGLDPDTCEPSYEAWRQTIHPDDRENTERIVQEAARNGNLLDAEWRVQDRNGEKRWLMSRGRPVFDREGHPVRYIGVVVDVTERKAAEARMQESERHFRLLVDNAPEAIFIQTGMRFAYVNFACMQLYGAGSREELLGTPVLERFHPDLHAVIRERIRRLNEKHQSAPSLEQKHRKMNGEWIDVLVTAVPFRFEGEDGALVFVNDITQRKQAEQALKASEEKYRTLVENANEAIVIAQDGAFAYANPKMGAILGVPASELIGEPFVDYLHPDEKDIVSDRYNRRVAGETVIDDYDIRVVNAKGNTRWLHIYAQQITWDERPATLNLLLDLTEQRQAEENLKNSRELEKSILSSVPHGIFGLEDRKIFFANDAIEYVTGWKPEELIGKETRVFFRNDREWQEYGAAVYARMQTESAFSYEPLTPFIRKDGREMYCRTSFSRIGEGSSSSNRVVSTVEDITEAKKTEIALKASLMRFDQLAEQSRTFHWEVDRDGRYTFAGHAIRSVLGYEPEEIVGKLHFFDLHPLEGRDEFKKAAFAIFHEKETFSNLENAASSKEGRRVWLSTNGIPILNDDGTLMGYRGSDTDITARKLAEQERAALQNQLNQAQKMESIGRLAGGVAHDFNNMLGVILGHTEMAMEQVERDDQAWADLEEVRKAAQRSSDLTRQLLAFARKQTVSPKVLDLNETVESMLKMLRRLIGEDIGLLWKPGHHLWQIHMDPSQVDQILANLSVNARDAISAVGKVTIETGNVTLDDAYCDSHLEVVPGEYVMLAVSDNGCGMDKEILDKLFEPFFTTKRVGKGTGLGLATVYGIMKQNNGVINVYSEVNQGTTFKLYFPKYSGESDEAKGAETQLAIRGGQETILVVEDELAILDMTKRMLEKQGYKLLTAKTPGEALEMAKTYPAEIHLLITDVVMPEMNGRDLAAALLSCHPKIKNLFMSGYTANVIAHHGVLDEGVKFIQKPFSLRDLAAKVREALDQH